MKVILDFLNSDMNQPLPYGSLTQSWFHYISLILMVIGIVYAIKKMKNLTNQQVKKTLILVSLILIGFEIYKQIIFSYQSNWDYQWYAFPFQFCSTPMYITLLAGLTKNRKIEEALYAFLATFGLFAGLAVMFYPVTVFVPTIGINIQTMVHHGAMAILGFGLLSNHVKLEYKTIKKAFLVFAALVFLAIIMNAIFNFTNSDATFNMFFINPQFDNGLPILEIIQPLVSTPIFIAVYLFGFTLVAYMILIIAKLTEKSLRIIRKNA